MKVGLYGIDFTHGMSEIGFDPLPKVDGQAAGLNFADKNARLAAEFMRGMIAKARSDRASAQASGSGGRATNYA